MRTCTLILLLTGSLPLAHTAVSLTIQAKGTQSHQALLQWNTVPGRDYTVVSIADPTDPNAVWESSPGPWIAQANMLSQEVDTPGSNRFFQVTESPSPYDPAWAAVTPQSTNSFIYDSSQSSEQNGAALKLAMQSLQPGEQLEISSGIYSINSFAVLDLQGTAEAPIWITTAPDAEVVITRPNANQNILNVGANQPTRYLCLRGLEFVGGSHGLRLYDCQDVWVDRCNIHETGDVGLSANARDTSRLHITRNKIWNTGGTGEGMYLGGNNASVIMSESIIALNHVHDTNHEVSQGDGIEIKQGSWGNWIAENLVHDCNYPCILVYGTGGQPPNIVERNICFRSNDNTMQIQGECIVRNNLVMAAAGSAFVSQPHQGDPTHLTVVHNTFVNTGNAVKLSAWGAGADMVFANNACYSQSGNAIQANGGFAGVTFAGNICFGNVTAGITGYLAGSGVSDFVNVDWDGAEREARPSEASRLVGAADEPHAVPRDIEFTARTIPQTAGCYAR